MGAVMRRLVAWLAGLLSPEERDYVLGDLAETGAGTVEVVRELLGVIVRRQIEPWTHWRPWLVSCGLVAPCAILLNYIAARSAHRSAIFLWMYANNWDSALLRYAAFRRGLLIQIGGLLVLWCCLALWSWTAGRILRAMPDAPRAVNLAAFALLLFLVTVPAGPTSGPNAAVFTMAFYRVIYPQLMKAALVMLPYWRGTA